MSYHYELTRHNVPGIYGHQQYLKKVKNHSSCPCQQNVESFSNMNVGFSDWENLIAPPCIPNIDAVNRQLQLYYMSGGPH